MNFKARDPSPLKNDFFLESQHNYPAYQQNESRMINMSQQQHNNSSMMKDFNDIKERKEALLKSKGSLLGSIMNESQVNF